MIITWKYCLLNWYFQTNWATLSLDKDQRLYLHRQVMCIEVVQWRRLLYRLYKFLGNDIITLLNTTLTLWIMGCKMANSKERTEHQMFLTKGQFGLSSIRVVLTHNTHWRGSVLLLFIFYSPHAKVRGDTLLCGWSNNGKPWRVTIKERRRNRWVRHGPRWYNSFRRRRSVSEFALIRAKVAESENG